MAPSSCPYNQNILLPRCPTAQDDSERREEKEGQAGTSRPENWAGGESLNFILASVQPRQGAAEAPTQNGQESQRKENSRSVFPWLKDWEKGDLRTGHLFNCIYPAPTETPHPPPRQRVDPPLPQRPQRSRRQHPEASLSSDGGRAVSCLEQAGGPLILQ